MAEQSGKSSGEIDRSELFRLLIESAADFAIFTIDPAGRATSWNPSAERLLGYAHDEIIGESADVIFTPQDRDDGIPALERRQPPRTARPWTNAGPCAATARVSGRPAC